METVTEHQETDQICRAILNAFGRNEYLNIADFRLFAEGSDSETLAAAIKYLIENEYMAVLDADDLAEDVDAGNAEVVYARVTPIGNHGE